ncbi:hypothetical protein BV898_04443 [Hypsibius exemplaris]|uniref:J domain-containing protein n=1 Tax=Hypsibius exemplaris TaxID=2072580 RepID=A0A1W0X296_HYPEX|nr:hypothetical protein BV898_04443 [Hypsibius exemplaris]
MSEVEAWAEKNGFRICLTAAQDGRGVPEILPFLMEISSDILARREVGSEKSLKSCTATPEQIQSVYRIIYGEDDWERLGVPQGSNGALVSKAYRRLATQIHPDKCPINGSGEAFKLLTASKDALLLALPPKDKNFLRTAT